MKQTISRIQRPRRRRKFCNEYKCTIHLCIRRDLNPFLKELIERNFIYLLAALLMSESSLPLENPAGPGPGTTVRPALIDRNSNT